MPASPSHGCAWITGASSGIGAALALELAARGYAVAATARRSEALDALVRRSPGITAFAADVTDEAAMRETYQRITTQLGPVGLLVANAGVYLPVDARAPVTDAFRRTFEVNLMGVVHAIAQAAPAMTARARGHIHIVSSATGFGGMPTSSAYGASKAALINMASCLKIELDRCGVGVSISTPGFVDTPAQRDNAFPKPAMMTPELAAQRIADAVARGGFETSFPHRFTWPLKLLYALPKPIHLPLVRWRTGWSSRDKEPPSPTRSSG